MMRRRDKINLQLDAVFYINAIRGIYSLSFKQLASMLKIPESTLCRYANMEVLPSAKAAADIVKALRPMADIRNVVSRLIKVNSNYIDLSSIVLNPTVLKLYERHILEVFSGLRVTRVLTAAVDGIPLAMAASYALNAGLTIAKQYMDAGFEQHYEATYMADSPPRKVSLYIPRLLLTKEDSVIIVDDIVRSGRTVDALLSIIRQAGASLVGVSILVAASRDAVKTVKSRINGATLDVIYTIE